jgi:hypothetical protein
MRRALALAATTGILASTALAAVASGSDEQPPAFVEIGRYSTGRSATGTTAEIVAVSGSRLYVTNAPGGTVGQFIDVVDITDPTAPVRVRQLDVSSFGADATSVVVGGGVVAVAVPGFVKTDPGKVVLFDDATGALLSAVTVGALPDMVTFTDRGRTLLVANEAEPNDAYTVDPEGSISIIDVKKALRGRSGAVRTAGFAAFNVGARRHDQLPAGVRVFGPGASVAQDLEPEYIAVAGDTAYVTLQENNAIAIVDIDDARVERIVALGTKDHSQAGNGLDPSDTDGVNSIGLFPVAGMYQPDGIAAFESHGDYVITANEGDVREWGTFVESKRLNAFSALLLTPEVAGLQATPLGRLNLSIAAGDSDGDGLIDEATTFGARSVSIRDKRGNLVWDSGDLFEQITAAQLPLVFNASNSNATRDNRSDDKGPEPEGVTTGKIGDHVYAFVTLERIGGVVILDVTRPTTPSLVTYLPSRQNVAGSRGIDQGPEGIVFVDAEDSPTGNPLVFVGNEVSGTVTVIEAQ